jgi:hypothetical protein
MFTGYCDDIPLADKARFETLLSYEQQSASYGSDPSSGTQELHDLLRKYPCLSETSRLPSERYSEEDTIRRYQDNSQWNMFLKLRPLKQGFAAEANSLIKFMRTEWQNMVANGTSLTEYYLVTWALYYMPHPIKWFMERSMESEELKPHHWTIEAFASHLNLWVRLFQASLTETYWQDCVREHTASVFYRQDQGGGGYIADFLYSEPEHQRWAIHTWRCAWHNQWAQRAAQLASREVSMTGM